MGGVGKWISCLQLFAFCHIPACQRVERSVCGTIKRAELLILILNGTRLEPQCRSDMARDLRELGQQSWLSTCGQSRAGLLAGRGCMQGVVLKGLEDYILNVYVDGGSADGTYEGTRPSGSSLAVTSNGYPRMSVCWHPCTERSCEHSAPTTLFRRTPQERAGRLH